MTLPCQSNETRSTCPYCGVGCGVLLKPDDQGGLAVRGDPEHPANFGRLCSKGSALGETVSHEGRLLSPQIDGVDTDWDTALDLVAQKFKQTIAEHGPDSVAFYVSGQLLTEDYYVANKLMKGFIGSANIDTNSRLCMASTVAGHKRAFGTDTVPGTYEDLEAADQIVLVGSNLAWCHPVLYQRIVAARENNPDLKIIVVDPRRTASCDLADLHLPLRIGSDVALFNGLLAEIASQGAIDQSYLTYVNGADAAIQAARGGDPTVTGLAPETLQRFYDMWINTPKTVTVFSQGVNQSSAGADKVNAILNCHLVTGRIGTKGCGPFSVTGQPNAMGGREVGGLANMLACHLDIENPVHHAAVSEFWQTDHVASKLGLKAVDMFEAVGDGRIKALWVIHTNPAVSMPDADKVVAAMKSCDFVVVSDITAATDTARLADVLLPASAWGEKDGTVTNSDRTISRQRPAMAAPGQARADWDILADVGRRMGWGGAFDFKVPADIFREYADMSRLGTVFGKDFDISALSDIDNTAYDSLVPQRWPITHARQGGRFFADGQFFTADGKANMLPLTYRAPAAKTGKRYPLRMNTGRIRDQWHTMTRTALSPRLSAHLAEPFIEIHPNDADAAGIKPSMLVQVKSPAGSGILRAMITDRVRQGDVFAPMHWTGETAPSARIDALVPPVVDPVSGQPESKAAVVAVTPFEAEWYGFAVSSDEVAPNCDYWARAKTRTGYRLELAGAVTPKDWEAEARRMFDLPDMPAQIMIDANSGTARLAFYDGTVLKAALFISKHPVAVMRDYLATLPTTDAPHAIAGVSPADQPNPGAVVCSCFNVGINTIVTAIEADGLMSVEAVGKALQAGTNCGSCRPEIADLLEKVREAQTQAKEAAE
ncbi:MULTISPECIES: nitrate reductase [Pacificibacter]|uniref:nitrate reductase n=1 Tax=Pacificibacter TaxID=1042323 RepID=UPI001C0837A4|nr:MULTISPECIES: nitrate reductase [Pacificibacter]MBU2936636.1 molybdopterin-dependent oxidoreductase [Pacificibacter marinus]MDO6614561.1 molybdopterin-dependent oxidoreductase [Pacificibacter sp. 1_MG-2023]